MKLSKLCLVESVLIANTVIEYNVQFNKPTVYNTVRYHKDNCTTYNTAVL